MNAFGNHFQVQVFGESHGGGIGVVVDGVRAGIPLAAADFEEDLSRRRSGARGTTPRREPDTPEILSGVFQGHTTGAPVAVLFRNTNTRPEDYALLQEVPRPGHADRVAALKWDGCNDPRGGGHFSGRVTLALVAAGVIAKKQCGFSFRASLAEVGGSADPAAWDGLLSRAAQEGDSLGGVVECRIEGVPAGLGAPFFDSVESMVSHAVFAIPGVRGIEFGDGFAAAGMRGSAHNDPIGPDGLPEKNGAGGVNGGITNGAPIVFRVAFKPTSSIARAQRTLNVRTGEMTDLHVGGRHDVCFALRTPVIVEAAAAIVLADLAAR